MIHAHGTTNDKLVYFRYSGGLTITLLDRESRDSDNRYKIEIRNERDRIVRTTIMDREVKESGDDLDAVSVRSRLVGL